MEKRLQYWIKTPISGLQIQITDGLLTNITFADSKVSSAVPKGDLSLTANIITLHKTINQLEKYFTNPHYKFTLPINMRGTVLQQKIWMALQEIPTATTSTYSDLANKLDTSPRIIGNACRGNPLPIIIPCHRVVAKNSIGGFAGKVSGEMIGVKKWLLKHEAT